MRLTWLQPEDLVRHEIRQAAAEGKPVAQISARWMAAGGALEPPERGASTPPAPPPLVALAEALLADLEALPARGSDVEPDDLDAIRRLWSPLPKLPSLPADDTLFDRLHGAWLGRAAGCLLGKPVEGIPRHGIREILEAGGRWPHHAYFSGQGLPDDVSARWPWNRASRQTSLAEVINGMPEDDDINYTLVALAVLERCGCEFTTDDVAQSWLADLPVLRTFTAERAAYRNLLDGVAPPVTAIRRNPFREWIGAQIRTDLYGWALAGQPAVAGELAWRDARLSHTRNGLYGAMFAAAMGAGAVVATDVATVIDCGLAVIPPESRLAKAIRLTDELHRTEPSFESANDRLYQAYGDLHWVHVINNAALVALALRFGGGDFAKSICLVVSGGWDTDSNGATVGGITGALAGAHALPAGWIQPLHNRLSSSLRGFDGAKFDDLARRTQTLTRRLA